MKNWGRIVLSLVTWLLVTERKTEKHKCLLPSHLHPTPIPLKGASPTKGGRGNACATGLSFTGTSTCETCESVAEYIEEDKNNSVFHSRKCNSRISSFQGVSQIRKFSIICEPAWRKERGRAPGWVGLAPLALSLPSVTQ